jgi:hypothetical protein
MVCSVDAVRIFAEGEAGEFVGSTDRSCPYPIAV